ncbi:MAG: hypothetical protein HRU02_15815 [Myxococcales bacterium]|nr:hypothetical protein [Myxococcales bacterium]
MTEYEFVNEEETLPELLKRAKRELELDGVLPVDTFVALTLLGYDPETLEEN